MLPLELTVHCWGILDVTVLKNGDEQPDLRVDVMQQPGDGQPALVGDVLHRQPPEAAFGDQLAGRLHDLPPALSRRQPDLSRRYLGAASAMLTASFRQNPDNWVSSQGYPYQQR